MGARGPGPLPPPTDRGTHLTQHTASGTCDKSSLGSKWKRLLVVLAVTRARFMMAGCRRRRGGLGKRATGEGKWWWKWGNTKIRASTSRQLVP